MEARMTQEPALNHRRFVSPIVVEHEMDAHVLRDVLVDRVEELSELDTGMPSMMLGDDAAGLDVERSKERRGSVPHVVVSAPLDLPGTHRKDGLAAIQRLNLWFLVDTK